MRSNEFQERHYDYVLSGPSLAAGQIVQGLPLQLDPDAPFELRSRALRVPYDTLTQTQAALQGVSLRYTDAAGDYLSQGLVPQALEMAYFGQGGNPKPVYPPQRYPAQGVIKVDVKNNNSTTLTGLTLYFRGVKLFKWGQRPLHTYPPKFTPLPFTYPVLATALPVTTPTQGLRYTFTCRADADFVLRALQAGINGAAPSTWEVFLTLRDADLYPYSNAPVHLDVLCGNSFIGAVFPCGSSALVAPVGPGPASPGLLYPEIYVPKNNLLYIDVLRADVAYAGAAQVDLPIAFLGMKVFA